MKIIGSQTGAYEYFVEFPNGKKIWLGKRTNSDTDILLRKDEKKPEGNFDIFYGEPFAPFIENGKLHTCPNFDYLMFSLCNKMFLKNLTPILIKNYKQTVSIYDALEKKVGEIFLEYEKIPKAICLIIANYAKNKV